MQPNCPESTGGTAAVAGLFHVVIIHLEVRRFGSTVVGSDVVAVRQILDPVLPLSAAACKQLAFTHQLGYLQMAMAYHFLDPQEEFMEFAGFGW